VCLIVTLTADDDETALPDDIAVCEEDDEEGAEDAGTPHSTAQHSTLHGAHVKGISKLFFKSACCLQPVVLQCMFRCVCVRQ
jgi:hypothetical protein